MRSVIDYIFSITESILIFWLIDRSMFNRFFGVKKICAMIVIILINTIVIHDIPNFSITINFILYFISSLILAQVMYKGKISIKAFIILVANYIFLISDIIAGNIASYLIKMNIQSMLNILITSFSFSIFAKLLNVVFSIICADKFNEIKFKIPQKYLVIMDIIVFFLIITLQFIMHISPILQKDSNNNSLYILGKGINLL